MNMDFWEDQNIEEDPKETGLIFNDAIQTYLDELLWQKIDQESFEMETDDEEEDEESLDDLSATEVLEKLDEQLGDALNSAKLDVKLFALQIQPYIERLKELTDD